jgi:hypothetical protein
MHTAFYYVFRSWTCLHLLQSPHRPRRLSGLIMFQYSLLGIRIARSHETRASLLHAFRLPLPSLLKLDKFLQRQCLLVQTLPKQLVALPWCFLRLHLLSSTPARHRSRFLSGGGRCLCLAWSGCPSSTALSPLERRRRLRPIFIGREHTHSVVSGSAAKEG